MENSDVKTEHLIGSDMIRANFSNYSGMQGIGRDLDGSRLQSIHNISRVTVPRTFMRSKEQRILYFC